MLKKIIIITIVLNFFTSYVNAYIGPGVGGGAIMAILGFIVALLGVIIGLFWFPIKRLLKKTKEKKDQQQNKVD